MKFSIKPVTLLLTSVMSFHLMAQDVPPPPPPPPPPSFDYDDEDIIMEPDQKEQTVFYKAERMPVFPGECEEIENVAEQAQCTERNIINFIVAHSEDPEKAREQGLEGRLFIEFIINKEGIVEDIKVLKGVHELLDNSAVNAVKQLPVFKPAMQRGVPVKLKYVIPVNFKLPAEEIEELNTAEEELEKPESKPNTEPVSSDSLEVEEPLETVDWQDERMPIFPGECEQIEDAEEQAMCTERNIIIHVTSNQIYPDKALEEEISGKVIVEFVLNENGVVEDVKVIKGVHELLDQEAIRVVKTLPVFTPAMQRGKAVKLKYTIPVNFKMH